MKSDDTITKKLLALVQTAMTFIAAYVATEIKDMSKSLNSLNIQVATLLAEVSNQKDEVRRLESRIENVEKRGLYER